jgi:hypothetical protein
MFDVPQNSFFLRLKIGEFFEVFLKKEMHNQEKETGKRAQRRFKGMFLLNS